MAGIARDLSAPLRVHRRRLRALARTAPAGSYRNPQHPPTGDEPGRLPAGCGLLRPCTGRHGAFRCNPRPPALRAGNRELRPRSRAACRRPLAAPSPRVAAQRVGALGAERTSRLPAWRRGAGLRPPLHNRPRCAFAYSARLCSGSPRSSPAARGAALDACPRFAVPKNHHHVRENAIPSRILYGLRKFQTILTMGISVYVEQSFLIATCRKLCARVQDW